MVVGIALTVTVLVAFPLLAWRSQTPRRCLGWLAALVVLAGVAGLAVAPSVSRHEPAAPPHEPLVTVGPATTSPRPFYPDNRLFVARLGTGLDPAGTVDHLPRHVQTLPEIHDRYVDAFVRRPGFGEGRYRWAPSQWIEFVAEGTSPPGAESAVDEQYPPANSFTTQGAERPRYDDERTLLWQRGRTYEVRERVWLMKGMQLIGLLKGAPTVYAREATHPGKAAPGQPAPTRPLDQFEADALAELREGRELVARTTPGTMRVAGAIRAREACLSCHDVARGDLLGAFSYTLALRSEETPAANRLADLTGLRPDEGAAVQAIEKVGGVIKRDDTGTARPVTSVTLAKKTVRDKDEAVKGLRAFRHLRALDLSSTKITDETMRLVGAMEHLTSLNISGTAVTDAGLRGVGALRGLRSLNLWSTKVTDAGLKELEGHGELEDLYLAYTGVTDAGMASLARLKRLRKVELMGVAITDAALPHFTKVKHLEELGLARTKVTGTGLKHLTQVRALDLSLAEVSDEGLRQLGELAQLRTLGLNRVGLTAAGLAHLRKLTNLQLLELEVNDLSEAEVAPLRKALPRCRIDR